MRPPLVFRMGSSSSNPRPQTKEDGTGTRALEALHVVVQRERVENQRVIPVGAHSFRILPDNSQPLLFQIPRSTSVISLRYAKSTIYLASGLEIRHVVSLLPWVNRTFPSVRMVPQENELGTGSLPRTPGLCYPVIDRNAMKLLFWNAKGAARQEFQTALKNYIRRFRPLIVIITDTRISYEHS